MQGTAILGVALPQWHPGDMTPNEGKDKPKPDPLLLNRLRSEFGMIEESQFLCVTASDDETARVFKFNLKEPRGLQVEEDMVEEVEQKKGFLGAVTKIKDVAVGAVDKLNKLIKRKDHGVAKLEVVLCVASGIPSKTTKKMDGAFVLQRSLTENQANYLYSLKEQARDMRKKKAQVEQEARRQEFKFRLDVEAEKEEREDIQASKFNHYQNLAEPPPKTHPKRRDEPASNNRGQCAEGGCSLM